MSQGREQEAYAAGRLAGFEEGLEATVAKASTPYYQDDLVTIYHGDCREVLAELPPVSVDVLLTDPPYGMAYVGQADAYGAAVRGDGVRQGVRLVRQALFAAERALSTEAHLYVFCHWESWPDFYDAVSSYVPMKNALIWWKRSVAMGNWAVEYARDYEVILYGARGGSLAGGRDGAVIDGFRSVPNAERVHPTEKPVALLRYLIGRSAFGDGYVLDPFMGGGSTLVAAKEAGRRAIGIEIEERYCEIAATRCSQEVLGLVG